MNSRLPKQGEIWAFCSNYFVAHVLETPEYDQVNEPSWGFRFNFLDLVTGKIRVAHIAFSEIGKQWSKIC
jgi:hypothetical protein